MLSQFGVDEIPYRNYNLPYTETAGRRFSIIFGLSLPITMGFSYGVAALAKQGLGGGAVKLTGPETAGFIGVGLILSGLIGWYDHIKWTEFQASRAAPEDLPPANSKPGVGKTEQGTDNSWFISPDYNRPGFAGEAANASLYRHSARTLTRETFASGNNVFARNRLSAAYTIQY